MAGDVKRCARVDSEGALICMGGFARRQGKRHERRSCLEEEEEEDEEEN